MSWNVDECSVLLIGDFPRKKHEKNLMIGVRTVGGNFCLGLPRQPWRKLIDRFANPPTLPELLREWLEKHGLGYLRDGYSQIIFEDVLFVTRGSQDLYK